MVNLVPGGHCVRDTSKMVDWWYWNLFWNIYSNLRGLNQIKSICSIWKKNLRNMSWYYIIRARILLHAWMRTIYKSFEQSNTRRRRRHHHHHDIIIISLTSIFFQVPRLINGMDGCFPTTRFCWWNLVSWAWKPWTIQYLIGLLTFWLVEHRPWKWGTLLQRSSWSREVLFKVLALDHIC